MNRETSRDVISRRTAVRGVATAGLGVPLLAACGGEVDDGGPQPDASAESSASEPATDTPTGKLGTTADIPVNGGKVFEDEKVVVVQPTEGEFKAYEAVCPHQKCVFTEVTDNTIKCGGCHKAEFASADGANTAGPNGSAATLPGLGEVGITVDGDSISLA
ncbi:MAG: Rieske (2Fe-2S) protein [Nocardioides sp.]